MFNMHYVQRHRGDTMARTRNNLDFKNRRIEFIQESLKILFEEGYGKLGINYLIRRMDISKGSFFSLFQIKG